jgi:hypothetical protein
VIKVGVVGGVLLYLCCVVLAAAGFTNIVPLIVIVPILVLLVGGGNMLGGRSHGRTRGGGPGFEPAPLSSSGPNSPAAAHRPVDEAATGNDDSAGQQSGAEPGGGEPGDHE